MTQYLLSVHGPAEDTPEAWGFESEERMQRAFAETEALNAEMQKVGVWVFGGGLQPVSSATVVDNRDSDGDVTLTDGPYAENEAGRRRLLGDRGRRISTTRWPGAAKASAACFAAIDQCVRSRRADHAEAAADRDRVERPI